MINFHFRNQTISNYKVGERKLNSMLNKPNAPVAEDEIVNLQIYYRTRRLISLIIKNKLWKHPDKHMRNHVVYQT